MSGRGAGGGGTEGGDLGAQALLGLEPVAGIRKQADTGRGCGAARKVGQAALRSRMESILFHDPSRSQLFLLVQGKPVCSRAGERDSGKRGAVGGPGRPRSAPSGHRSLSRSHLSGIVRGHAGVF